MLKSTFSKIALILGMIQCGLSYSVGFDNINPVDPANDLKGLIVVGFKTADGQDYSIMIRAGGKSNLILEEVTEFTIVDPSSGKNDHYAKTFSAKPATNEIQHKLSASQAAKLRANSEAIIELKRIGFFSRGKYFDVTGL